MSEGKITRPRVDSHFKVKLDDAENRIRRLEDVKDYDDGVTKDTLAVTAKTKLRLPTATTPIVPSLSWSSSYELHGKVEDYQQFSKNGYIYGRYGNHSCDNAAHAINKLEGGIGALVFSTGMSAITTTVLALIKTGDHVVAPDPVFGGTYKFFSSMLKDFGVETTFVPAGDIDAYKNAIKSNTKLFYAETPTNPTLNLTDLKAFADVAKSVPGAISMCDSTFATPYLQDTLGLGVDISFQSCTKYLGGHGDLLGGSMCTKDPELFLFLSEYQKQIGNTMGPFTASILLRGIRTLPLRMEKHCSNAFKIARYLETHPKVSRVRYPGLESYPQHDVAKLQMKKGFGGMVNFEMKGGLAAGKIVMENIKLILMATSLGGTESLMEHPASMTHGPEVMSKEEREAGGISDGMIRFSVGVEDPDDLIRDLEQALAKA
ncbi:L-methionine gamma-lyase-like [Lytechinus variegatus]|uniref:L-methionine gamma-lyase-like n=1 Tax=Lytechinus variegatus TaxID=7654 RepID=UPI001BB163DE|nr:L-methionine gamma-lyase-like [Lytechinus variegatus]